MPPAPAGARVRTAKRRVDTEFALGMRDTLARHGIATLPNFVEAMTIAGLLVERRLEVDGTAPADGFRSRVLDRLARVSEPPDRSWIEDATDFALPPVADFTEPGEIDLFEGTLAAAGVAGELAAEYNLDPSDELNMIAASIGFAALVLADDEDAEEVASSLSVVVRGRIRAWRDAVAALPMETPVPA